MSQDFEQSSKGQASELPVLQGARILAALEAVKEAAKRAGAAQQTASAILARQRTQIESAQEAWEKLATRGRDLRNSLQLLRESVDRAKLTALNAGLEGARLGDPVGKALVMMGDEVRNLLARAIDALEEHTALLAEVDRDRERCLTELTQISEGSQEAGSTLARSADQSQLATALLAELRTDLGEAFGTDPEAARVLAHTAGQVKTLANSLLELSQRSPVGMATLRELLDPLLALVSGSREVESER